MTAVATTDAAAAVTTEPSVMLPATAIHDALAACVPSTDKSGTLPVLGNVRVTLTGRTLTFLSTDRYRLTRVTRELDDAEQVRAQDFDVLLPLDEVKRLVKMLPKPTQRMTYGGGVATLIPREDGVEVWVDGSMTSIRAMQDVSDYPGTTNIVPQEDQRQEVSGVGLNPTYLTDLAKMPGRQKGEPLRLEFYGERKPVVSRWDDHRTRLDFLHLIMQMNDRR